MNKCSDNGRDPFRRVFSLRHSLQKETRQFLTLVSPKKTRTRTIGHSDPHTMRLTPDTW
ncbi:hypothetical protein [Rhodopirellula sallentina]|uniref:Uncharacterized protein n=1 Tax=Rhodopirellula sallentina SM41 TaxID=1263870 RepID=M5UI08_9BACT|nr:hypothetical protein [Rhodopirellula sallentina]EMI57481.1 hypothetical protein RSSM_01091 [Rhodopirellula sallentina SM41]